MLAHFLSAGPQVGGELLGLFHDLACNLDCSLAGLLDLTGRRLAHFGDCQCRHVTDLIERLGRGDRRRPVAVLLATREIAQGLFDAAFDLPEITERELCAHKTLLGLSQRK